MSVMNIKDARMYWAPGIRVNPYSDDPMNMIQLMPVQRQICIPETSVRLSESQTRKERATLLNQSERPTRNTSTVSPVRRGGQFVN